MIKSSSWRLCRYAFVALVAVSSGCGYQTYETRLAESAKYFAYVQRVDSSVSPAWKNSALNPGPIEQLRVPLQFREIKKPPPPKTNPETGEEEPVEIDPRQPDYVGLEFPGLVGTWEANCRVAVDGKSELRKGYLYVLTNAYMFSNAEQSRRAPDFVRDLLTLLAEKLPAVTAPDPVKDVQKELYPRTQPFYVPQKSYDVYRLADALTTDGVTYTIEIYVQHSGPVDVALVLVLPVGMDSNERLSERIPYMLETLQVSPRPPVAPAKKTGGGGPQPATAPPPF